MKPEARSRQLLAITRSKGKMYEYGLPEEEHIRVTRDPERLLRLAIGILGDLASMVSSNEHEERLAEIASSFRFAARYFDAYAESKLARLSNSHLLLLASATYYLCDLPGSSRVLVSRVQPNSLNLDAGGLDGLLWWLLYGKFSEPLEPSGTPRYRDDIGLVSNGMKEFYALGAQEDGVSEAPMRLRRTAYKEGTPRELLFADACCAIVKRRIETSARRSLPEYSRLPLDFWEPVLGKESFVRELWPAQRLLGQRNVFAGESAVVQMPTSAGKSRATEIIIRSAFLSGRASLAIVVGPFRALCHEIRESLARAFKGEDVHVNELTDVFQRDFDLDEIMAGKGILVMTPEKLVYVLRHAPGLADRIGLLILDEGHQFDAGPRGVTYELLVTSLKGMLPSTAQKVLISAVITNASEIAKWFNGDELAVVAGRDLLPTERSVAFASWTTQMGQLRFVVPENPDEEEFFVPRVIRPASLALKPREKVQKFFPTKDDSQSVALYLGLKLVMNGAVAIFCGRKDTATSLCNMLTDVFDRGLDMPMPISISDRTETVRLAFMYEVNLGAGAAAVQAAKIGAFTHHGNTPHGVRLAVEHAIKEGLGRFVLCTSTLAQGVNLPIRYLLVTTARQGGEQIKVRDFQNLMGRAGRSGMHTEGSVLFANPEVYDTRGSSRSKWPEFKKLLQVANSEPCASTLLSALGPLKSDGGQVVMPIDPLDIVRAHIADELASGAWIDAMAIQLTRRWFSANGLRRQLMERRDILRAVESFLLAHWAQGGDEQGFGSGPVGDLAKQTLAYHLASSEQRAQLIDLFEQLSSNVAARVAVERRRIYGRTLLGIGDTLALEQWVAENRDHILACVDEDQLFSIVWPCISARVENNTFKKWRPDEAAEVFARSWIAGDSFGELYRRMLATDARIGLGTRARKPNIEHIVEMGESAMGFDGAHVLGAIAELFEFMAPDEEVTVTMLQRLQKRLKYGLPSEASILLYEAGFADRPLAIELAEVVPGVTSSAGLKVAIQGIRLAAETILHKYPQYFVTVFQRIID